MKGTIDHRTAYQTALSAGRALLFGESILPAERESIAAWIVEHENHYQGYTFYPTAEDLAQGVRLFTGEKPQTLLARNNAVELEVLRVLVLLQPESPETRLKVRAALHRADSRLSTVCYGRICPQGECAYASISVLRYRTVHDAQEQRISPVASRSAVLSRRSERLDVIVPRTLDLLRGCRSGDGKWERFPFHYTVLWLTELVGSGVGLYSARGLAELALARQACERMLDRSATVPEPYDRVRRWVLERALILVTGTGESSAEPVETGEVKPPQLITALIPT